MAKRRGGDAQTLTHLGRTSYGGEIWMDNEYLRVSRGTIWQDSALQY